MSRVNRWALLGVALSASLAFAHYPIVSPPAWQATKGETLTVGYTFGHPFEVELAPASKPAHVWLYPPQGERVELTETLRARGSSEAGFEFQVTPQQRGDHWVVVESQTAHGDEQVVDHTKLALHVSNVQRGWERRLGLALELVPLSRPYGLPVGAAFRAQAWAGDTPLGEATVSVEYKNDAAPKELPPEVLITRVERTAPDGTFTATLDRAGWWILSVEHEQARGNLWVWVGP